MGADDAFEVATMFGAVERRRSFDEVVDQVREAVVSGRLRPGDRLPAERNLSTTFGISRATLREALRALEAIGVIDVRPGAGGGVYVAEPNSRWVASGLELFLRFSSATANELAEFRESFEGENAYWASLRAVDSDLQRLEEISDQFARLAAETDVPWQRLSKLDLEFHETIAKASRNQIRIGIMTGISGALYKASVSIGPLASSAVRASIVSELRGILSAVKERDSALARSLMGEHVRTFAEMERGTGPGSPSRSHARHTTP